MQLASEPTQVLRPPHLQRALLSPAAWPVPPPRQDTEAGSWTGAAARPGQSACRRGAFPRVPAVVSLF